MLYFVLDKAMLSCNCFFAELFHLTLLAYYNVLDATTWGSLTPVCCPFVLWLLNIVRLGKISVKIIIWSCSLEMEVENVLAVNVVFLTFYFYKNLKGCNTSKLVSINSCSSWECDFGRARLWNGCMREKKENCASEKNCLY